MRADDARMQLKRKYNVNSSFFSQLNLNMPVHPSKTKFPLIGMQRRWFPRSTDMFKLVFSSLLLCISPTTASVFAFRWQRRACAHCNDDSCFPSWLNATAVSINIFLSGPAGCLVWQGMHLTQPANSRPTHHLM